MLLMPAKKESKKKNSWRPKIVEGEDKRLIHHIQGDLPLSLTPFAVLAEKIGWDEKKVLQRIQSLKKKGIIRRFGAILRHQKAGFLGNALVVWEVPEELIPQVSKAISAFPAVSHCYLRPTSPKWPYNLYTMIHGPTIKDCYLLAQKISRKTGIRRYQILPSLREFKKSSMEYFSAE